MDPIEETKTLIRQAKAAALHAARDAEERRHPMADRLLAAHRQIEKALWTVEMGERVTGRR
jgi:hypothetical protein